MAQQSFERLWPLQMIIQYVCGLITNGVWAPGGCDGNTLQLVRDHRPSIPYCQTYLLVPLVCGHVANVM